MQPGPLPPLLRHHEHHAGCMQPTGHHRAGAGAHVAEGQALVRTKVLCGGLAAQVLPVPGLLLQHRPMSQPAAGSHAVPGQGRSLPMHRGFGQGHAQPG